MTLRLRVLLVCLGLSSLLFLWVSVDWSVPLNLYRNYRQLQTLTDIQPQMKQVVELMKAEFGENVDVNYSIHITANTNGVNEITRTVQVTQACGNPYGAHLLKRAFHLVQDAGLGRVSRLEYLYGCDVAKH